MKWLWLLLLLPALALGFPDNGVIETFDGSAQPIGAPWSDDVLGVGGCQKVLGVATRASSGGTNSGCYLTAPFGDLQEIYAEVPDYASWPNGQAAGFLFCVQPTDIGTTNGDAYAIRFNKVTDAGVDTFQIVRIDNNSVTALGSSISQEGEAGMSFGVHQSGSGVFDVWYKPAAGSWTNMGQRIDTETPFSCATTHLGLLTRSVNTKFDNLGGGITVQAGGGNPFMHLLKMKW